MKKFLLTILTLTLLIPVAAFAGNHEDQRDTHLVSAMHQDNLGAQVRTLQLVRSLDRNIIIGEETIAHLNNTGDLEDLLVELQSLRDYADDENPLNASEFIATKRESQNITQQFKNISNTLLDEQNKSRAEIMQTATTRFQNNITELNKEISELAQNFNKKRTRHILNNTNANTDDVEEAIENNATGQEIAQMVRQKAQGNPEVLENVTRQRQERLAQAKESVEKARQHAQAVIQEKNERASQARQKVMNKLDKAQERVNNMNSGNNMEDDTMMNETQPNTGTTKNNNAKGGY